MTDCVTLSAAVVGHLDAHRRPNHLAAASHRVNREPGADVPCDLPGQSPWNPVDPKKPTPKRPADGFSPPDQFTANQGGQGASGALNRLPTTPTAPSSLWQNVVLAVDKLYSARSEVSRQIAIPLIIISLVFSGLILASGSPVPRWASRCDRTQCLTPAVWNGYSRMARPNQN